MTDEPDRRRRVYRAVYDLPGPKLEPTPVDWIRLFGALPTPGLAVIVAARVDAAGPGMAGRGKPQATQPTP